MVGDEGFDEAMAAERHNDSLPGPTCRLSDLRIYSPVRWRPWHRGCWRGQERYAIDVERIRTLAQVCDWTAHLMGKAWLRYTDWPLVLRTVSGGIDA